MTKEEQDRLNTAVKVVAGRSRSMVTTAEYREFTEAAKPLLEKEPRVFDFAVKDAGDLSAHFIKVFEMTDTPWIVQKGEKPVRLAGGYTVNERKCDNDDAHIEYVVKHYEDMAKTNQELADLLCNFYPDVSRFGIHARVFKPEMRNHIASFISNSLRVDCDD